MTTPKFLNDERPVKGKEVILPSRLNVSEFHYLLTQLEGQQVCVLAAEEATIDPALLQVVEEKKYGAFSFSVNDEHLSDVGRTLKKNAEVNTVFLFLPPQVETLYGGPIDVPSKQIKALCDLGLPIVPLAIHRTADNRLRVDESAVEPSAILCYGTPISDEKLSVAGVTQSILQASERAFSSRAFLNGSLTVSLFKALYHNGRENFVHDGVDDTRLTYHRILAASLALSDHLKKNTQKQRVGIILPPGKGGLIANLAVLFAGKIPVNLNFTSARKAVESSVAQADLDLFVTADRFIEKLPGFPWPARDQMVLLDKLVKKLKPAALRWLLEMKFSSAEKIIKKRGLSLRSNHDEAVLLFTSGSSGMPKGVPLSHRNLLANICQFGSRIEIPHDSTLLGCLPLFHSFGCTVTTFFPLLQGYNLVTYPSPLETKKLGELIKEHGVSMLTATPTFLRGYIRRVQPDHLTGLNYIVTGAEKLPQNLAQTFEKRFGYYPQEGYGLTETSPASHINLPAPEAAEGWETLPTSRRGTVGIPLVGVAMKITDAISGEEVPLSQSGCVWLKGANVFNGYLDKPEVNAEVIQDGWFNTGDIGFVDNEGFLTLEGRLSRFSKIAGEMVPHENVEAEINKILDLDNQDERKVAIVGVPDEKKGEALLLLTCLPEYDAGSFINDLKKKLIAAEIPALWCPKTMVYTPQIPILASGKLDLAGCREIAVEAIRK